MRSRYRLLRGPGIALLVVPALLPLAARAQENAPNSTADQRIAELTALVQKLEARVEDLEARLPSRTTTAAVPPTTPAKPEPAATETSQAAPPATSATLPSGRELLRGTTVNLLFDGYYDYNFNQPIGRVNLLRAYEVTSNAFSLSQADFVLENPVDPDHGKRFGLRLDLQFGQATETLQGSASNELRPDVWRNLFQAYGTCVIPVGNGLTLDFGKWASSLGIEGNYSKDQINYSRSFWFDFLPFYHTGVRMNYKFNGAIALNYWVTNGTEQTEPFNAFKDELIGLNLQPGKTLTLTTNYYLGQEHPDVQFFPNQTIPGLPTRLSRSSIHPPASCTSSTATSPGWPRRNSPSPSKATMSSSA